MLEGFDLLVRRESLYCHQCREVKPHDVFSRTFLDYGGGVAPDHRLLARCCSCGNSLVLFASDFRCFFPAEAEKIGCKIAGRSRLVLGDRVYVKGLDRLGTIERRSRTLEQERLTLDLGRGETREVEVPYPRVVQEETARVYLLVPRFVSELKISDWVYHTQYEVAGRMVGVIHGRQEQRIIRLENDAYLLLKAGGEKGRVLEDTALLPSICAALRATGDESLRSLNVSASHGIVYLKGQLGSLPARDALVSRIEKIPGVLVVVPKILVVPEALRSDAEIFADVQDRIAKIVLEARVSVRRGNVDISGRDARNDAPDEIYSLVSRIPGVASVRVQVARGGTLRSPEETGRKIMAALRNNSALHGARIYVRALDGVVYLEGSVVSNLQRATAEAAAQQAARDATVVNSLRIEHALGPSFVQLAE